MRNRLLFLALLLAIAGAAYLAGLFERWGFGFIWSITLTQSLGFVAAAASM